MTLIEKLRQMPVDKAATFIFETATDPCNFCAQNPNKCPNTTTGWDEYEKAKRICVNQITVGLLQEV